MNKYENLLNDLLFGAKDLIDQTKGIADKFEMSIKLAKEVRKAIAVMNQPVNVVQMEQPVVNEQAIEAIKEVHLPMTKERYEEVMGYKISQAAYDEYVDIFNRQAAGEELCLWLPDPDGIQPIPEGAIVTLATKENPIYKHLFEEQEEIVEEESVEVKEDDIPIPTNVTAEVAGAEVAEEIENMSVEEVVEKVLAEEDNGVEIDIDEDPVAEEPVAEEPEQVVAEIDGEELDITEQYNLIKSFNAELSYDDAVERAVDWIEFGINKETYDLLNFIEDESAEMIQCKTYLAYYIDAMEIDSIVYYINYFASNIEEDEEGNEVYVNEELQLEFLNKDNISAFLEYVQQNQQ
jgi:hypothetical protein